MGPQYKVVASINSANPAVVILEYQLNVNLPEDKYIEAFESVTSLQRQLSNSCSYVYVASMLQQVHKGQENARTVFENDQSDLENLNRLRMTNFMTGLTLDTPPERLDRNALEVFDLQNTADRVSALVMNIDITYKTTYDDYIKEYVDNVAQFESLTESIQKDLQDLVDHYDAVETDLEAYKSDLERIYQSYLNGLDTYLSDYRKYCNNYYRDQYAGLSDEYVKAYTDALEKAYGSLPPNFDPDSVPGHPGNAVVPEPTGFKGTLPDLTLPKYTGKTKDTSKLGPLKGYLTDFTSLVGTFVPDDPFTVDLTQLLFQFQNENANDMAEYQGIMDRNYYMMMNYADSCTTHVNSVQAAVAMQYLDDSKTLKKALDEFYDIKSTTSDDIRMLLSQFDSIVPNSRTGSMLNQQFINATISPIDIKGDTYRPENNTVAQQQKRLQNVMLAVIAGLVLVVIITYLVGKARRKKPNRPQYM